jgi:hypothetical protein
MKKNINILSLVLLVFALIYGCEEEIKSPTADFRIEVSDSLLGTVTLEEPYEVSLNEEFTIVVENDAEFNSFWPGDTLIGRRDTIIQVYPSQPSINHRGIALGESGILPYSYDKKGTYEYTFVSVNVNNLGEELKTDIRKGTIKVSD